jgi:hypothetical protein
MYFARSLLLTHMQQTSRPPIVALLVGEELMLWIMPLMDDRMSAHSPLRLYFASSNESVPGDRTTHPLELYPHFSKAVSTRQPSAAGRIATAPKIQRIPQGI